MHLGQIVGTVVASTKDQSLTGVKLLLLQPLDHVKRKLGDVLVAADPIGARPGDYVMWVASREASLALPVKFAPVDAAVVGLVDSVDANGMNSTEQPSHQRGSPL